MAGDGPFSNLTRPISRSRLTTKKIAWAATSRQRQQTGSMSKVTQFSPRSKQYDVTKVSFEMVQKRFCDERRFCMRKYLLASIGGVGLIAVFSFVLNINTKPIAAQDK